MQLLHDIPGKPPKVTKNNVMLNKWLCFYPDTHANVKHNRSIIKTIITKELAMNLLINIVRVLTVIFYLVAGFASFIEPIAMYAQELMLAAAILVMIHASEFVVIRKNLLKIEPNFSTALINTLIFGVTYWKPLMKQAKQQEN